MRQEFNSQDLTDSVFWGVFLKNVHFRDADFTGSTMFHVMLKDVAIDGEVDRLVINGVDVTDFVNQGDRWFPLRSMLTPSDSAAAIEAWDLLEVQWAAALARADALSDEQRRQSVDGEWSFIETLRHLVMAMDKWFTLPVLRQPEMHPIILPNVGSNNYPWPGRDITANPNYDDVRAVRAQRAATFRKFIASVTADELAHPTTVLENGEATVEQVCTSFSKRSSNTYATQYATSNASADPRSVPSLPYMLRSSMTSWWRPNTPRKRSSSHRPGLDSAAHPDRLLTPVGGRS